MARKATALWPVALASSTIPPPPRYSPSPMGAKSLSWPVETYTAGAIFHVVFGGHVVSFASVFESRSTCVRREVELPPDSHEEATRRVCRGDAESHPSMQNTPTSQLDHLIFSKKESARGSVDRRGATTTVRSLCRLTCDGSRRGSSRVNPTSVERGTRAREEEERWKRLI